MIQTKQYLQIYLFFALSMAISSTGFSKCLAPKNIPPDLIFIETVKMLNKTLASVTTIEAGRNATPAITDCTKTIETLNLTIEKDVEKWIKTANKKEKVELILREQNRRATLNMFIREITRIDKLFPELNIRKLTKTPAQKTKNTVTHKQTKNKIYSVNLEPRNLDNNPDTIEAYYDPKANITWLANANATENIASTSRYANSSHKEEGLLTWIEAKNWAASLNMNGITGWRLPNTKFPDDSCIKKRDYFVECTGSEMGNLYHNVLGKSKRGRGSFDNPMNYNKFYNIKYTYWSATESQKYKKTRAWAFSLHGGGQEIANKEKLLYAWAIHSGDVKSPGKTSKAISKPKRVPSTKPEPNITGCWSWSNGANIVINTDGSAHNGPFAASWKAVDSTHGRYSIAWPSFVDTLTLSADGSALTGKNNYNLPVTATRKSGKASSAVGNWLWSNGVTVSIHSNSSVTAGALKGKWMKSGNKWIIEWPLVDTISLSKDGRSLNAKNQFGAATASRKANCKGSG